MIFFEFIATVFIEGLIEEGLRGLFKLYRKLGVLGLKVITLDKTSFKKLDKEYYKDSSKPYFVTLFIILGIIFLFN